MRCPKAADKPPRCVLLPLEDQQPLLGTSARWQQDGTSRMGHPSRIGPRSSQGCHVHVPPTISYLSGVEVSWWQGNAGQASSASRCVAVTSHCPAGKREGGRGQSTPRAPLEHPQGGMSPTRSPHIIPTCHHKDQESRECRDAEELAEGAGGEEEEEEGDTG